MPVLFLERLPLPSLRQYVGISLTLVCCSSFYAHNIVLESKELWQSMTWRELWNVTSQITEVMIKDSLMVWVLINLAYCCLLLIGRVVQYLVFGNLRVSEQENIKEKFWNFLFYKFIFIFGVLNVQLMEEVFLWSAWFSILGFFHILNQLCKDRFEYLSFSPSTGAFVHGKVMTLLLIILFSCLALCGLSIAFGIYVDFNTFAFMIAECLLLCVRTLYVITKYVIHLYDLQREMVWEKRSVYVYYTELVWELSMYGVDFAHHLHMLLWSNIFLSMASLVICMQLRFLFHEIKRRIKRHKNYQGVVKTMRTRFPMANDKELTENSDKCAICWDRMEAARKLPCGHLFHDPCLRSWMEHEISCPTCRESETNWASTSIDQSETTNQTEVIGDSSATPTATPTPQNVETRNHFFHFDGSRYVSWFPSFSVEVTHTNMLGPGGERVQNPTPNSVLDRMAREVQSVFPHMPLNVLMNDLQQARSIEQTIENILEGRLVAPPIMQPSNLNATTQDTFPNISTAVSSGSANESVNFITDENLPDFHEEPEFASVPSSTCGGRFSKNAHEREVILDGRKNEMIEGARRRFLRKQDTETEVSERSGLSERSGHSVSQRREVMYRATQRRLQLNNTL